MLAGRLRLRGRVLRHGAIHSVCRITRGNRSGAPRRVERRDGLSQIGHVGDGRRDRSGLLRLLRGYVLRHLLRLLHLSRDVLRLLYLRHDLRLLLRLRHRVGGHLMSLLHGGLLRLLNRGHLLGLRGDVLRLLNGHLLSLLRRRHLVGL